MDGTGFQPNAYQSNAFQIAGQGIIAAVTAALYVFLRRKGRR